VHSALIARTAEKLGVFAAIVVCNTSLQMKSVPCSCVCASPKACRPLNCKGELQHRVSGYCASRSRLHYLACHTTADRTGAHGNEIDTAFASARTNLVNVSHGGDVSASAKLFHSSLSTSVVRRIETCDQSSIIRR